eukprot:1856745-Prymnesium_polylepis.1
MCPTDVPRGVHRLRPTVGAPSECASRSLPPHGFRPNCGGALCRASAISAVSTVAARRAGPTRRAYVKASLRDGDSRCH